MGARVQECKGAQVRGARWGWTLSLIVAALAITTAQEPTFRAGVTLVSTDVIARDDKGRFVSDLTREDFVVREDGVEQSLASFSLVLGGRTYSTLTPLAAARPAPEGIVLPPTRRSAPDDAAGRVVLIFIDDLHFEPEQSPQVRKVVQQLTDTLMHDGDLVAVMSSGPSFIEIGPTYDKKAVLEAVSKIRGSGPIPAEIFKSFESSQGVGDVRARAQMAFFSAYNILGELEKVSNKRKAVIYISTGYDFDPFAAGRAGTDRVQGGRFADPMLDLVDQENPYFKLGAITADIELHKLMRELVLSANRANATIYTVDPRGLSGVVDLGSFVDQSDWRTYLQKTTSSLRFLAESTGGFPVVNTNDFVSEFKRIDAETSDYYVLGFYSSNPDPTKRTRRLEVTVKRPNLEIASRQAYSLKTPGTPPAPPPLKPKPLKKK